ncbi:MAG: cytochrome c biogenesis protein CcdA [Candidatus Omnitrophica bacterium]|nr:cytochrome c biogenesis protein CcdA [Candidatus Omnitrophota bacterium]
METETISLWAAFAAGLLTFLSPCILPVIPAYISYITGISFDELKEGQNKETRKKIFVHSLLFILGFSVVFVALGASASYVGKLLIAYRTIISRVGGGLVIIFGLYLMGVFKLNFLNKQKKADFKLQKGSKIGSLLLGITFAAAWTPCVGPILGSVLVLAGTSENMLRGVWLLSIYSLGIAIPFITAALLLNSFLLYFAKVRKYMSVVKFVCGLLLIFIGLMLILGVYMV